MFALGQVRFEKGLISTPQLLEDIDLPDSLSVLGQNVDLSPLKQVWLLLLGGMAIASRTERVHELLTSSK